MADFIREYCSRLNGLKCAADLKELYAWFYHSQAEIVSTVDILNRRLGMKHTPYAFKPDLPCLSVGRLDGVLILGANPAWSIKYNKREQAYCAKSANSYVDFMSNFFERYLDVVHHKSKWWTRARNFVSDVCGTADLQVGGWELIPFHSERFKGAELFADCDIHDMARASVRAALRMRPKLMIVASKEGTALVRSLLPDRDWLMPLRGSIPLYRTVSSRTEIIALRFQLVRAKYPDKKIRRAIRALRGSS